MRRLLLVVCCVGCAGPAPEGDDTGTDSGVATLMCPLPMASTDAGALPAWKAQMCNVPGSQGGSHWYRLSAALPGSTTDYVQIELWDGLGAFSGGTVHSGTFSITGDDADRGKCGVCVRGIGAKGASGTKEYFATGGTVKVDAVGGNGMPFSVTLTNASFVEIDASTLKPIMAGCTATVASAKIDGMVTQVGGNGGGGGGGGGGGSCATGVGD